MSFPLPLKILGLGRYLPRRVVPSAELEQRCGLEPGWVEAKQGIRQRHWASGEETASMMGAAAAREAAARAGLEPGEVDLLLNASGTPEQTIPDGGPLIQRQLGLGSSGLPCLSVHATCLSFLVALDISASLLAAGRHRRILIVTSDVASVGLDFGKPEICTLFGDGAAAAVVGRTPEGEASCVQAARLESYGEGAELTQIVGGGTRRHPNRPDASPEENLFQMEGRSVYKMAFKHGPAFLEKLFAGIDGGPQGVDLVVPHQASKLALDAHRRMGFPEDKLVRTIGHLGNCVGASIPLTLYEAVDQGRLQRGDRLLLVGTGAGLNLGGMVLIY
jgi:3-oxoacyl-[acyl-carrier-protein] synthase-3